MAVQHNKSWCQMWPACSWLNHCATAAASCRRRDGDLVDVVSEADAAAQHAVAVGADTGDFGAKLVALLGELRAMRRRDKQAKAVIFSSWARWGELAAGCGEAGVSSCVATAVEGPASLVVQPGQARPVLARLPEAHRHRLY